MHIILLITSTIKVSKLSINIIHTHKYCKQAKEMKIMSQKLAQKILEIDKKKIVAHKNIKVIFCRFLIWLGPNKNLIWQIYDAQINLYS